MVRRYTITKNTLLLEKIVMTNRLRSLKSQLQMQHDKSEHWKGAARVVKKRLDAIETILDYLGDV